jgi:hypothetical protein
VETLTLHVLGCHVHIRCTDPEVYTLLTLNYGQMQQPAAPAALQYTAGRSPDSTTFFLRRRGQPPCFSTDPGAFLFHFEKELTIALQRYHHDRFYVLHSAVLALAGHTILLVGASGSGKSLTTWALLHHGFDYFSDELAPVDTTTGAVSPYPHALCLKTRPPDAYPVPPQTLCTTRALYIPVQTFPSRVGTAPLPLAAVFFIQYHPEIATPGVRTLSTAEAAARLYSHSLNPLAHPMDGLQGAIAISTRTPGFALWTATLPATCALIHTTVSTLLDAA